MTYHEKRLRGAMFTFAERKQHLRNVIDSQLRDNLCVDHSDEIEHIKELQKVVRRHQRKLSDARKQLEAVTPKRLRRNLAATAANKAMQERFLAELNQLKV